MLVCIIREKDKTVERWHKEKSSEKKNAMKAKTNNIGICQKKYKKKQETEEDDNSKEVRLWTNE